MSTTGTTMDARTLKVDRATLYYEVRGSGPVLLLITGGPTDAGIFTDLAGRLAERYTVVSYDQRGHSRSTLDGEPEDLPPSVHADDAAALFREVGDGPAYVYGSSGGGRIGLELVARHPELVRTLVSHEAPLSTSCPTQTAGTPRSPTSSRPTNQRRLPSDGQLAPCRRRGPEVQRGDGAGRADAGERGDGRPDGGELRPVRRPRAPADRRALTRHRGSSKRPDADRQRCRQTLGDQGDAVRRSRSPSAWESR